jgi:hypothetical protein
MALTISGDGLSQAVYLRQNGLVIEYSVGATPSSYTTISSGQWPVTITNTASPLGTSSILRVVATTNLTFTSSYGNTTGYLIAGSTFITFDGSGNTITISSVLLYPGFIQNGTSVNGFANIVVQNFTTARSGTSTLANNGGWLCQTLFGRGVIGTQITGCTNNADFSANDSGGIVGQAAGRTGTLTITNCANTGAISGTNAGGIVGSSCANSAGTITITRCANSGVIAGTAAGGIIGYGAGNADGLVSIINCYSTGTISGSNAGGIAGSRFAYNTPRNCVIRECYSTGNITGADAGGIVGADVGNSISAFVAIVDISNCYSLGTLSATCGGICGGTLPPTPVSTTTPTIRISNCYSFTPTLSTDYPYTSQTTQTNVYAIAGTWSDATANTNLIGVPSGVGISNKGTTWTSISANIPYLLSSYWLLTNPTQIYTPNNVSTFTNYTSSAGSYSPGIYSIQSSNQSGATITINVAAIAGTSPKYYGYYNNIFTLTNLNGGTGTPISATINASNGVLDIILPYPCFLEGTKILCFENNEEVYRPVESLQKGDLVKTIYNGYMPVCMMGATKLYNPGNDYRVANRIYKCPKEKYPTLFEDLYITGCHSILVPSMTDDQWENTKAVNGNIYVTDNHFRLIACADEKAEPFNKEGFMNIYHVALDHHDIFMNYGIYANGLLVESCSIECLMQYSNMKILGKEDCAVSQDVDNLSNNMTCQLVDTY